MTIPCPDCGRRFGGHETYSRHFNKSEQRCRTEGEMKARGLVPDVQGIWRRPREGQASLIDRRTLRRNTTGTALAGVRGVSGAPYVPKGSDA